MLRGAFLLVVGLAAGACGRIGFAGGTDGGDDGGGDGGGDPIVCATPVGHDEDGDGTDDACDLCPHVADAGADADGDGVGDACDPYATATEHLRGFDPFLTATSAWMSWPAPITFPGDVARVPGVDASIAVGQVAPPEHELFVLTGEATEGGTGQQRQLSMGINGFDGPDLRYFCEQLTDFDGAGSLSLVLYDHGDYMHVDDTPALGPIDVGPLTLSLLNERPDVECRASWAGQELVVRGAIPAEYGSDIYYFALNNLDADLTSFARIQSTP